MADIRVSYNSLGSCSTNCYIVWNDATKEAVIVDPAAEADVIRQRVLTLGVKPVAILLTHGHFDHILAAAACRESYAVPVYAMEAERTLLGDASMNLSAAWAQPYVLQADQWLQDGALLPFLGTEIRVLHTPGHTPGGCCYYFEQEGILLSGDTLFAESLGRTDFPGSSTLEILQSIRERLFVLPEDVTVYPGHGDETTIGHEKQYNPVAKYRGGF